MKSKMLIPLCVLMLSACNNSDNSSGQTSDPGIVAVAPDALEEIVQDTTNEDEVKKEDVEKQEKASLVFDQTAFDTKIALLPLEEPLHFDTVVCTPSKNVTYRNLQIVYHGNDIFELTMHFVGIDLKLNLSLMEDQLVMISSDTHSSVLLKNLAAQGIWSVKDATESSLVLSVKASETNCELTFKQATAEQQAEQEEKELQEPTPEPEQ